MTVAAPDFNLSAHDDEELVATIAFLEDRLAFCKIAGRNSRAQEMMETAFYFLHSPIPMRRICRHLASPLSRSKQRSRSNLWHLASKSHDRARKPHRLR